MPAPASELVEPVETRKVTILARRTSASFQLAVIVTAAVIVGVLGLVLASLVVPGLWPDAGVLSFILLAGAIAVGLNRAVRSLLVRAPRARARARQYQESEAGGEARHGLSVLRGRVAYAAGASEAMHVEILEWGKETNTKGGWVNIWTEESRRLTVRPFYLVRDDGTRIRVDAKAQSSQLFDDLETGSTPLPPDDAGRPRRTRFARLDRNEDVWVAGRLGRGEDPEAIDAGGGAALDYRRDARPPGLVLRADPTLLVSTVSLVDHFTERARLHRNQGIFALVLLLAPLGMTARFVDRFEGHAVSGVVQSWHVVKDNKTNTITGYRATILADGTEWGSELLIFPPQANKPYVLRIGSFSSNDGPDFHATSGETVWSAVIFAMTVLAALVSRQNAVQSLPWYRAASTFVERSQGRLDAES